MKAGNYALAIRWFNKAKEHDPDDSTIDGLIQKCKENE